jgi:hypothetical protein
MKGAIAHVAILGALVSCLAANTQDPSNTMHFIETNSAGQRVRELAIELSSEPAKTCLSGAWKSARAVKDVDKYMQDPAYRLENGRLEVLLVNGPCDAYDSYRGTLLGGVFSGDHVTYGMRFSKTLGRVTGSYSKK